MAKHAIKMDLKSVVEILYRMQSEGEEMSYCNLEIHGISTYWTNKLIYLGILKKVRRGLYGLISSEERQAAEVKVIKWSEGCLLELYDLVVSSQFEKAFEIIERECLACGKPEYADILQNDFYCISSKSLKAAQQTLLITATFMAEGIFDFKLLRYLNNFYINMFRKNFDGAKRYIESIKLGIRFGVYVKTDELERILDAINGKLDVDVNNATKDECSLFNIYLLLISGKKQYVVDLIIDYCTQTGNQKYIDMLKIMLEMVSLESEQSLANFFKTLTMISMGKFEYRIAAYLREFYIFLSSGNYEMAESTIRLLNLSEELCGEKTDTAQLRRFMDAKIAFENGIRVANSMSFVPDVMESTDPLTDIYSAILEKRYGEAKKMAIEYLDKEQQYDYIRWAKLAFRESFLKEPKNLNKVLLFFTLMAWGLFEYNVNSDVISFYYSLMQNDFQNAETILKLTKIDSTLGKKEVDISPLRNILEKSKEAYYMKNSERQSTPGEVSNREEQISPEIQKKLAILKTHLDSTRGISICDDYSSEEEGVVLATAKSVQGLQFQKFETESGVVFAFYTGCVSNDKKSLLQNELFLKLIGISRYLRYNRDICILEALTVKDAEFIREQCACMSLNCDIIGPKNAKTAILRRRIYNFQIDTTALIHQAKFETGRKNYGAALDIYFEILERKSIPLTVYYYIGKVYLSLGDNKSAHKFYSICATLLQYELKSSKQLLNHSREILSFLGREADISSQNSVITGANDTGVKREEISSQDDISRNGYQSARPNIKVSIDLDSKLFLITDIVNPQKMEDAIRSFNLSPYEEVMLRIMYVKESYMNGISSAITDRFFKIAERYPDKTEEMRVLLQEIRTNKTMWLNRKKRLLMES